MTDERSRRPQGTWPNTGYTAPAPSGREAEGTHAAGGAEATAAYGNLLPTLPKGGGALRGIGEKATANPATGTGSMSIPIATSTGRSNFGPSLALAYDSAAGNGPFGMGWTLPLPSVTRKTDKGLPRYRDAEDSDIFLLGGAEDLVPVRKGDGTLFEEERDGYRIHRFTPRTEAGFSHIERWTEIASGDVHWRTISSANLTAIYGKTEKSRIFDPSDHSRVYGWLICETWDDKGNAIVYDYVPETSDGIDRDLVYEANRTDATRCAQRYLKHIRYGNRISRLVEPDLDKNTWLFEVVFDYDEGHVESLPPGGGEQLCRASIDAGRSWSVRPDPFSRYRAGFELRTYRRCTRVLMFHRFDELGAEPYLVRSTEFDYADLDLSAGPVSATDELAHQGSTRFASFLRSATHAGYIKTDDAPVEHDGASFLTYSTKSLPPVEFEYIRPVLSDGVDDVDGTSLRNLPVGLDGNNYRWVDLDGEGLSGLLSEQGGAWFYKRNVSALSNAATFGPVEQVAPVPFPGKLARGAQHLMDLRGSGELDVVDFDPPTPGLFERTPDGNWLPFRGFESWPNVGFRDPDLRLIDLTGDGSPDLLITDDDAVTWYEGLGTVGFGRAERVQRALDEELGPRVVFDDGTQSIHLADLCGDGLTSIVRIRNGEICYWPNLGYGRFGAKVTMDNAPWFDSADQFDPARVRLADVDGSGATDLIYLGRDGIRLYFNQAGNRWSDAHALRAFPRTDDLSSVSVVDLLGNGTACLVWSSPLAHDAPDPMRYLRLMEEKPHLMNRVVNNMGGEVLIRYAPSTKFYLKDRAEGRRWLTKLPFPVHVIEQVETVDHIAGTRFTSRYAYHHGYFDAVEREFRGFGMVEQFDTEAFEDYLIGVARIEGGQEVDHEFYQPPIITRMWFHTGAYFDGEKILHGLRDEYYLARSFLPDATLPGDLDAEELRQCVRALKGSPLRTEVYDDVGGGVPGPVPYLVTENSYEVRLVQHRRDGTHAIFHPFGREAVSLNYERNADDPRVAHGINLEIDPYGNVVKSASIIYGRRVADPALPPEVQTAQARQYVTYVEVDHTVDIDRTTPSVAYRLRVPYETRNYEITGIAPTGDLFAADEIAGLIAAATPIDYETVASGPAAQKRLLAQNRVVFNGDDLNPLPLGQWDTLGIPHRGYQLAFTPGVIATYYAGEVTDAEMAQAGYVHFDGDANWWIPSGTSRYPANPEQHFYISDGSTSPLGLEATATFDKYDLLVERARITQAPWSEQVATNDYRVLGPILMTDPNQNRSAVEIDALGMVIKSAIMGKAGSSDGDTLADPTARMEYDVFNWKDNGKPNYVRVLSRETHGPTNTRWQESYVYSNASGGVAMSKTRVHPGKALTVAPDGTASEVDADPRWLGNGRTIVNNKGNPVKSYEPYFSTTHEYEDEAALRLLGETPINFYDALGRNLRTQFPNGTLSRVDFSPWMQRVFDTNDTVKESAWYADRGSPDPAVEPEPVGNPRRRAAWLAAQHADTPATSYMDSLGRPCFAVADYSGGKLGFARTEADLGGRNTRLYDHLGRLVSESFIAMAGAGIFGERAEKGRCWTFQDVTGALVKTWDEHGRRIRTEYDVLHRPVSSFVIEGGGDEVLFHHVVYGDRHPDAVANNLLGATHMIFDQAGQVRVPALNFKGNAPLAERLLCTGYQQAIDWSTVAAQANYSGIQPAADLLLDTTEVFQTRGTYDALDRPTEVTMPDGTLVRPTYNAGGVLTRLSTQIRGQGAFIDFLKDQDYDAKGQRLFAQYGNDLVTRYFYDPETFRLIRLLTVPSGGDPATQALQDLDYTFDPIGNVTDIVDNAQQTYFFKNSVVKPKSSFTYDAGYRLVRATGREHASIVDYGEADAAQPLPHPNDQQAVRNYTEDYEYDLVGNITLLRHRWNRSGATGGWKRHYHYAYQDDPTNRTNRLVSSSAPGDPDAGPYTATYDYDANGNMTRLPNLPRLSWGFLDQLRRADLGGGGIAYYVYASGGERMRKVIERDAGTLVEWITLGPVQIYRKRRRQDNTIELERWTVHIADNTGTIAQVDTKTIDTQNSDPANPLDTPLVRYQYGNHLGSAVIETNDAGTVISYEEYHPYGTSAYRLSRSGYDLSLKRFRYCGKERDDESGFYYFGARYYAPWLARWTSTDPAGYVAGFNLYRYCANNPVTVSDPSGTDEWQTTWRSLGTELDPVTHTRIDTIAEFERWAVRHGVQYEGTPHLVGNTFQVTRYRMGAPGTGGQVGAGGGQAQQQHGVTPGAGTMASVAQGIIQRHPEGHIHELTPGMSDDDVRAYNERVQERAVAIRSRDPGSTSRTRQIRRANQQQVDDFVGEHGPRPPGTDVGHRVQLQDIGRNNDTVRPEDLYFQPRGPNRAQGGAQYRVNQRRISEGVPEDVPAGAVARSGPEMADPHIQPGFRGAVRGLGYGLMVLGPALTYWGASHVQNQAVRYTGYGLSATEGVGVATYFTGRFIMGGGASGLPGPLSVMRVGGGITRIAGGTAGIVLGTYGLVHDIQTGSYGTTVGDVASIVGGGAVLAGSAPVAAITIGVGLANTAGDFVERQVTPRYGRTAGVASGTLAGAAVGAAAGAAIGVFFFGVGAPVGAAIGGAIGAVAGFIGAFW